MQNKDGDGSDSSDGIFPNLTGGDTDRHLANLADPPVKVPELPPDPLDEHGVPLAAHTSPSTNSEQGLSPYTIHELANWYEENANRRRVGVNMGQDALDRDLRRLLAERGVRLPDRTTGSKSSITSPTAGSKSDARTNP